MKRWLLWNVRCLRGRRCADVRANGEFPPGLHPVIQYTCGNCGTTYLWDGATDTRQVVA